jgi:DHA1 family tetracycline resistance protein-like MFS transporter
MLFKNVFFVLYVVTCMEVFCFSLMQPVISDIRRDLEMEPFMFGFIGTSFLVFSFVQLLSQPLSHTHIHTLSSFVITFDIGTIYGAATFVSAPLLGRLSDQYGRKVLLIMAMLGSGVSYIILVRQVDSLK